MNGEFRGESDESPPLVGPRRRPIRLRLKLALLVVASLLAVGGAELLLRLVAPQYPSWLEIYRNHPAIDTYTLEANVDTVVDTGEGQYAVRTDEHGRRVGSEGANGADPRPVMLVLGDSYTFGQGVSYEDSFAGRLDASSEVVVRPINAAVGGYGPTQYLNVLEYLLDQSLHPKMALVVVYTGNDFHDCLWDKKLRVTEGVVNNPQTFRAWLKRSSHLYRLLSKFYHVYGHAGADEYARVSRELALGASWETGRLSQARELVTKRLEAMRELCAERSVSLGVVLIPTERAVASVRGELPSADADDERLDELLPIRNALSICESLGLQYLDLTEALAAHPTDATYFRFDGHFTPLGHRVAAGAIKARFSELTGTTASRDSR